MSVTVRQDYKMSFSTGGLFLNESIDVARLHGLGGSWDDTIVRALAEGTHKRCLSNVSAYGSK
jgi:hypothetical protein